MPIPITYNLSHAAQNQTETDREERRCFVSELRMARQLSLDEITIRRNNLSSFTQNQLQINPQLTHLILTQCNRECALPSQISASIVTLSFENSNPYISACSAYSHIISIRCYDYAGSFARSLPWPKNIESLTLNNCSSLYGLDLSEYLDLKELHLEDCCHVEGIVAWPPHLVYLLLSETDITSPIPALDRCINLSYITLVYCLPQTEQTLNEAFPRANIVSV
jgi:hypothetical protein